MGLPAQYNYAVRCKQHPGAFKIFFPSNSIIYHQCTCGKATSYDNSNKHLPYFKDHLEIFRVYLKPAKDMKEWPAYFDYVLATIAADPDAHRITWEEFSKR